MLLTTRPWFRAVLTAVVFLIDVLVWGGETRLINGQHMPVWLVLSIGLLGYSCLLIARSPVPGYIALLILSISGLVLPAAESFAGFLLALFLMARLSQRRLAYLALAGAALPAGINIYTGISFHPDLPLSFALINTGLWVVLILGVWIAGRTLARTDSRLVTERRWAETATEEARAIERLRISRDLHDTVAHSMTGIVLQVAGLRAARKAPQNTVDLDGVLADIQTTAEQSMRELHRLLGMLRTTNDGDGASRPHGLVDIPELIAAAKTSGLTVTEKTTGTPVALDPSLEHTTYRVIQEGLSNAMKHAGEGAQVEIHHRWDQHELTVTVHTTSGVVTTPAVSGGYGLIGLRERVGVSGGQLHNGPTATGYLLQAVLPTTQAHPSLESLGDIT